MPRAAASRSGRRRSPIGPFTTRRPRAPRRPPPSASSRGPLHSCSRPGMRARRRRRPPTAGWSRAVTSTASSTGRGSPTGRWTRGRGLGARGRRRAARRARAGAGRRAGTFRATSRPRHCSTPRPTGCTAPTVNLPARAMTGHNWTGAVMDWTPRARAVWRDPLPRRRHDRRQLGARFRASPCRPVCARGVYAAHLERQRGRVPRAVLRPTAARSRAQADAAEIAFLASTATYTSTSTTSGRFASRRDRAVPRPADGAGRGSTSCCWNIRSSGLSTYDRHSDGSGVAYSSRLRPATNVRPTGRHWNFNLDLFIVDWLEHLGCRLRRASPRRTCTREGAGSAAPYAVVLTGSHPEYDSAARCWTRSTAYLRQGGRLMYLGGNGFYWRIAHHPTRRGVIEVRRGRGRRARLGRRARRVLPQLHRRVRRPLAAQGPRAAAAGRRRLHQPGLRPLLVLPAHARRAHDPRVGLHVRGHRRRDPGRLRHAPGRRRRARDRLRRPGARHAAARAGGRALARTTPTPTSWSPRRCGSRMAPPTRSINRDIHADLVFFETPDGRRGVLDRLDRLCRLACPGTASTTIIARLTTNVLRRFADATPFTLADRHGDG